MVSKNKIIQLPEKVMNVKEAVYTTLREAIITSNIEPGTALSEKELSLMLKVSRTPVREALSQLVKDGLVEIYPQRGTYVTYINREEVIQSQFIRESLEVAVITLLTEKITEEQINILQGIINEQMVSNQKEDYNLFYQLDEKFHQTMVVLSGYYKVWDVVKAMKIQMDRIRHLSLPMPSQIEQLINQHQGILDAIKKRDGEQVEKMVRVHLKEVFNTSKIIEKHGDYFR